MIYTLKFKANEHIFKTLKEVICFLQDRGYDLSLNASFKQVMRSLHDRDGMFLSRK